MQPALLKYPGVVQSRHAHRQKNQFLPGRRTMQLYSGHDLDAANAFIGNLDEDEKRIFKKKLRTGAEAVLITLKPDFSIGFVNDPT
jgi:hypothetical protein